MDNITTNNHITTSTNCDHQNIYHYHGDDYILNNEEIVQKKERLKTHPNFEIMKQKNMPLSDIELFAMICWTDSICCKKMKQAHRGLINKKLWQVLYYHATHAVQKMHRVFHYKNNNTILPQRLHHGSQIISLDQFSKEQLFLKTLWSFSTKFSVAKGFSTGSVWIMDKVDRALRSGTVTGADVSWISEYNESEFVLIPTTLYNLHQMTKREVIENNYDIPGGIKIYITTDFKSNIDPLNPHCDSVLGKMTPNYNDSENEEEYNDIKEWFDNKVGLTKIDSANYFNLFIDNDYTTFEKIKYIERWQDVKAIGINKIAHAKRIFKKIKLLYTCDSKIRKEAIDECKVPQQPNTKQMIEDETEFMGKEMKLYSASIISSNEQKLAEKLTINQKQEEQIYHGPVETTSTQTQECHKEMIKSNISRVQVVFECNNQEKEVNGKKEDNDWWSGHVEPNDENQDDEHIYANLVIKMNIFRWQNPHGFETGKSQWGNIKEEALQNEYQRLSIDNWNQTLRKSKVFFNSWANRRISTKYKGDIKQIVTLKLYTDFDKLQYELKRCFRFDTLSDIFTLCDFNPALSREQATKSQFDEDEKQKRLELEHRLCTFYWWRIKLLTVLNKFGKRLDPKIPLFHGVNGKMILNNGSRQNSAFYGPLSTSASYHVARTFATAKGMVLQVTTQFPKLTNNCRAFDASLISDYPEEKEWLIGFLYLRIKKVLTRPLNKNWKSFEDIDDPNNYYHIPLSSQTRSIFFAVHLFSQQLFSMSVHCEYYLAAFLYLQGKWDEDEENNDNNHIQSTKFSIKLQKAMGNNRRKFNNKKTEEEYKTQTELYTDFDKLQFALKKCFKFETFENIFNDKEMTDQQLLTKRNREKKGQLELQSQLLLVLNKYGTKLNAQNNMVLYHGVNAKMIIRPSETYAFNGPLSTTSSNLFKWMISFSKITEVYPNVKEIHFVNQYIFDDMILDRLLKQIKLKHRNPIKKIVFLYYNYQKTSESNKPLNDPDILDQQLLNELEKLKWKIKHNNIGKIGFKIRIYETKS